MKKIYGEKKIHKLRRSWDYPPRPLSNNSPYHPLNIEIYKDIFSEMGLTDGQYIRIFVQKWTD